MQGTYSFIGKQFTFTLIPGWFHSFIQQAHSVPTYYMLYSRTGYAVVNKITGPLDSQSLYLVGVIHNK